MSRRSAMPPARNERQPAAIEATTYAPPYSRPCEAVRVALCSAMNVYEVKTPTKPAWKAAQ